LNPAPGFNPSSAYEVKKRFQSLPFSNATCTATARESVKERELVVFFRNNHFSTIFKLDGRGLSLAYNRPRA
jgi:hypothetical protein